MRKFTRKVLILLLFCFLSIYSAVLLGRKTAVSPAIVMLHLSECILPCWVGIVPGKTTVAEARENIAHVYGENSVYKVSNTDNHRFTIIDTEHDAYSNIKLNTYAP